MRPRVTITLVLVASWLAFSCGGAGTRTPAEGASGTGGVASVAGVAGSSLAGQSGASGAGAGGVGGAAGNAAGASGGPSGGAGAGSGGTSSGGAGEAAGGDGAAGAPDGSLGFPCGNATCLVGQACIRCVIGEQSQRVCAPHPERDATGHAEAIAACTPEPLTGFDDCDGPEDCEAGEYCVAREGADAFLRCRAAPSTQRSCCFTCGALADCTICRSDQDCPVGEACTRSIMDGLKGCALQLP